MVSQPVVVDLGRDRGSGARVGEVDAGVAGRNSRKARRSVRARSWRERETWAGKGARE